MFIPLQDFILVKPLKRQQSKVLEVVSHEKYTRGLVVAVGPGERMKKKYKEHGNRVRTEETGLLRPMSVKVGDWVTLETIGRYPDYFENGIAYKVHQDKDVAFISDREYIDAHNSLTDAEIDSLIALHNQPLHIFSNQQVTA